MTTYEVYHYNPSSGTIEHTTIEADSFKTPSHVAGPVTFYRGGSGRYDSQTKVAHFSHVTQVKERNTVVENDPEIVKPFGSV